MGKEKTTKITLRTNVNVKGITYKKGVEYEVGDDVLKELKQYKAPKKEKEDK